MNEPSSRRRWTPLAFGCGAVSAAMGLLYWTLAALRNPGEPYAVTLLFRYRDTDYLPLIYSLARGQYSEFMNVEVPGSALLSFPVVSMLPHALSVALLGDAGFAVADVLVALVRFVLVYALLKIVVRDRGLAASMALLVVLVSYEAAVWNFRYPRPSSRTSS